MSAERLRALIAQRLRDVAHFNGCIGRDDRPCEEAMPDDPLLWCKYCVQGRAAILLEEKLQSALGDTGRATPAELPKQFALMTIRRWVDEGFAKMARHYGQPAPNGFAGEAAAAVWTHAQEILEAAVRAPSGEGRWQPIETHDGSPQSVLTAEAGGGVVEAYFSAEHGVWWELNSCDDGSPGSDRRVYPTHWQPLPAPPGSGDGPPRESAERTLRSIATMLGWANVPPRETLEREIAALKSRAGAGAVPPPEEP